MCLHRIIRTNRSFPAIDDKTNVYLGYKVFDHPSLRRKTLRTAFGRGRVVIGRWNHGTKGSIYTYSAGGSYPSGYHLFPDRKTADKAAKRRGQKVFRVLFKDIRAVGTDSTMSSGGRPFPCVVAGSIRVLRVGEKISGKKFNFTKYAKR
jgi:hypothetical protein